MELDDTTYKQVIAGAEKPLMILFMSEFCGPSHHLFPLLDEALEEDRGFIYGEVDVEKCPVMTREYQVKGTPMLVFFHRGEPIGSRAGTMDAAFLESFIADMLERCLA